VSKALSADDTIAEAFLIALHMVDYSTKPTNSELLASSASGRSWCTVEVSEIWLSADLLEFVSETTVRANGQVNLPDEVCRAARVEEGDHLEVELTARGNLAAATKFVRRNLGVVLVAKLAGRRTPSRCRSRGRAYDYFFIG
jgi:bifunctional DNA-binding transcriptional regulator/antitoxin component of YhaV-PrlF toxin-antitoxin module